jgi:hypothetical protein
MQGHAEVSTLAYLPKPAVVPTKEEWAMMTGWLDHDIKRNAEESIRENLLKHPTHAKLPRKEFGELLRKTLDEEVAWLRDLGYGEFTKRKTDPARAARDREPAAIFTPKLTEQMVPDAAASAKAMKDSVDVANEWQKRTGVPVGKRT